MTGTVKAVPFFFLLARTASQDMKMCYTCCMSKKLELVELKESEKDSTYSIKRDGQKITLTNGEILEATKALLHGRAADALLVFADVYSNPAPFEQRELIASNMVHSLLIKITREILETANREMGQEKTRPLNRVLDIE